MGFGAPFFLQFSPPFPPSSLINPNFFKGSFFLIKNFKPLGGRLMVKSRKAVFFFALLKNYGKFAFSFCPRNSPPRLTTIDHDFLQNPERFLKILKFKLRTPRFFPFFQIEGNLLPGPLGSPFNRPPPFPPKFFFFFLTFKGGFKIQRKNFVGKIKETNKRNINKKIFEKPMGQWQTSQIKTSPKNPKGP